MEIILIRHGEPDYAPCDERGFIGQGRALAPLTPLGVEQAEKAAEDPLLQGAELMISSPYTRALQTAAILSRKTGIPLTVEVDLHEWVPDLTWQDNGSENMALHREFWACQGEYPTGETRRWETVEQIIRRIDPVLKQYLHAGYRKIIIVAHGGVIRRLTGNNKIDYCTPCAVDYTEHYPYYGWVE